MLGVDSMLCPYCGAEVTIRGIQWECGFCGDFGVLSKQQFLALHKANEEPDEITITFSFSFEVDLPKTWDRLKHTLQQALDKPDAAFVSKLGAVVIYEIYHALADPNRRLPEEKKKKLEFFLNCTPDLGSVPSPDTLLTASCLPISQQEMAPYQAIGQLSDSVCGSFWAELIQHLPSETDLELIRDVFLSLGQIYQYFASDDECDGQDYDRKHELQEAFELHWYHNRYFFPDIDAAMGRLLAGDDSQLDDDCRDVLATMFPEYFQNFTVDDMVDLEWVTLISDLLDYDRPLGLAMWQALLDSSEPGFLENQPCADYILEQL